MKVTLVDVGFEPASISHYINAKSPNPDVSPERGTPKVG